MPGESLSTVPVLAVLNAVTQYSFCGKPAAPISKWRHGGTKAKLSQCFDDAADVPHLLDQRALPGYGYLAGCFERSARRILEPLRAASKHSSTAARYTSK